MVGETRCGSKCELVQTRRNGAGFWVSEGKVPVAHVRKIVDEFRIVTLLKAAPQTTVFHAQDPRTDRSVVLKLLNVLGGQPAEENKARFEEGIRRVGESGLPFFPEVLDLGFTPDGRAFLVTSLEEGTPLVDLKGRAPEEILPPLATLAGCLAVMESLGLSHLNITPGNVLVLGENVLLLGLGSVDFLGEHMRHSPEWGAFAAPELVEGDSELGDPGPRSDLYSTALVAAQLLGATVQGGGTLQPVVQLPDSVRSALADPVGLEEVLATCVRRSPADRKVSLAELAETLRTGGESAPMPDLADLGAVGPASEKIAPPVLPERGGAPEIFDPNQTRPAMTPEELASFSVEPGASWEVEREAFSEEEAPATSQEPPPLPPPEEPPPLPVPKPEQSQTVAEPFPAEGGGGVASLPPAGEPEVPAGRAGRETPARGAPQAGPPAGGAPGRRTGTVASPPVERLFGLLREMDRRLLIGGGVVIVLFIGVIVFLFLGTGGVREVPPKLEIAEATPPAVVVVQPEPGEMETPEPVGPDPRIQEARIALDAGDLERAQKILAALTADDVAALDEQSRVAYDELEQALRGSARDRAIRSLDRGLKRGDIRRIRRAMQELDALPRSEISGVRGLSQKMNRARKALRLNTLLVRARKAGDHLQVIERAQALLAVLPAYTWAKTLRAEAAGKVEGQAEDAAAQGRYADALRMLEKEKALWPEREGLDGRIEKYRRLAQRDEQLEEVLRKAQEALDARDPARGLEILGTATPSGAYVERFQELQNRLESSLRARDSQPPRVVLKPGFKLRFKKNQSLEIPFRVTDDLGVKSVVGHVRKKGDRNYRKVPLRHVSGDEWVFDLTPELHGKSNVDLFVVAEDASGHKGVLGTGSRPLRVLRKRWYQK